ncbi:hypothetical protein BH10BAC3_BH10BAC3_06340 [soil metagenome]
MIAALKNNRNVILRKLEANDLQGLHEYLQHLSEETKRKFGPHAFDTAAIINFYHPSNKNTGYIACDTVTNKVVAYAIIKCGYLAHDSFRLRSYGLEPDEKTDCTFAPSVTDAWQGYGLANHLFNFILAGIKSVGIKRIILWGGVQCNNEPAVNFYNKHGFKTLGMFEYNGMNNDMMMVID